MGSSERQAELFVGAQADLGECPVWDHDGDRLMWVDITAGRVHAATTAGDDAVVWQTDGPIGCIADRGDGVWIVAERDRLTAVRDWTERTEFVTLPIDADVRANDGKLDPAGRMIVGTMHEHVESDRGALYSWDGSRLRAVIEPVTLSNGLGWSADGGTMYYIDSMTWQVAAFDYDVDTGDVSARRVVAGIDPADGLPDGMCVGPDGDLWVALFGGGCVRRLRPDGTLVENIAVGGRNATSCAFGGRDLFITTARMHSPEEPGDGAVYVLRDAAG